MCLIEIRFTKKASEKPSMYFMAMYDDFFKNAVIVKSWTESEKIHVLVYVRYAENMVSNTIKNVFAYDRKLESVKIVA